MIGVTPFMIASIVLLVWVSCGNLVSKYSTCNIICQILGNFSSEGLKEYASAGAVAEEVFSSIRTVVSFGGEQKEIDR